MNELHAARKRVGQAAALEAQARQQLSDALVGRERENLLEKLQALAELRAETQAQCQQLERRAAQQNAPDTGKDKETGT